MYGGSGSMIITGGRYVGGTTTGWVAERELLPPLPPYRSVKLNSVQCATLQRLS
jgi:hypothetical protein